MAGVIWLGKMALWLEEERGRKQLSGSCQQKPVSQWMARMPLLAARVMVMESKETLGRVVRPWCQRWWLCQKVPLCPLANLVLWTENMFSVSSSLMPFL